MSTPTPTTKQCTRCKKVKLLSEFRRHAGRKFNRESQCKECRSRINAKWRARNRGHIQRRDRQYLRENYPKMKEALCIKRRKRRKITQTTAVNNRKRYTAEEDSYIMSHSGVLTDYQIAIHLGRTENAVQKRRIKLWKSQPKNANAAKK